MRIFPVIPCSGFFFHPIIIFLFVTICVHLILRLLLRFSFLPLNHILVFHVSNFFKRYRRLVRILLPNLCHHILPLFLHRCHSGWNHILLNLFCFLYLPNLHFGNGFFHFFSMFFLFFWIS